jgi:hypothetical protein
MSTDADWIQESALATNSVFVDGTLTQPAAAIGIYSAGFDA